MNEVAVSNLVGGIATVLVLCGVTGITPQDLTGFTNVIAGLIAAGSYVWSWYAHKRVLGQVLAGIGQPIA